MDLRHRRTSGSMQTAPKREGDYTIKFEFVKAHAFVVFTVPPIRCLLHVNGRWSALLFTRIRPVRNHMTSDRIDAAAFRRTLPGLHPFSALDASNTCSALPGLPPVASTCCVAVLQSVPNGLQAAQ